MDSTKEKPAVPVVHDTTMKAHCERVKRGLAGLISKLKEVTDIEDSLVVMLEESEPSVIVYYLTGVLGQTEVDVEQRCTDMLQTLFPPSQRLSNGNFVCVDLTRTVDEGVRPLLEADLALFALLSENTVVRWEKLTLSDVKLVYVTMRYVAQVCKQFKQLAAPPPAEQKS